ncbi:MAG: sodium:calcium antiporter [Halobacteriaceae archaeon]
MFRRLKHPLTALAGALLLTTPWMVAWGTGRAHGLPPLSTVAVSGVGILGASFMLAWGAEIAEKDVPRAFAIAVLAVLAVAPEYAVDALYAWNAGAGGATQAACAEFTAKQIESGVTPVAAACHDANLAVANMTGANRILIGLGWAGIALFSIYRTRASEDPSIENREGVLTDVVHLDRKIAVEITFLLAATLFAFTVPLGGGIGILDTVVLVGIYLLYIAIAVTGEVEEVEEQVGVPAYFHERARAIRVPVAIALFLFSGFLIYVAVHPFAHGLEELGKGLGIPSFFMIQWIAPLASESPELIVVAYLVNKARSTAGFNALISSKLNQWTLLIGTLAVVYSIGLGEVSTLPFDSKQAAEIWITAAQSFFAISVLVNFSISGREAVTLLALFASQVIAEFYIIQTVPSPRAEELSMLLLDGFAVVYVVLGVILFALRRGELMAIASDTQAALRGAFERVT